MDLAHAEPAAHAAAAVAGEHAAEHAGPILGPLFEVPLLRAHPFIPPWRACSAGCARASKVKSRRCVDHRALAGDLFLLVCLLYTKVQPEMPDGGHAIIHAFDWINFQYGPDAAPDLTANFSFYVDSSYLPLMLFLSPAWRRSSRSTPAST